MLPLWSLPDGQPEPDITSIGLISDGLAVEYGSQDELELQLAAMLVRELTGPRPATLRAAAKGAARSGRRPPDGLLGAT